MKHALVVDDDPSLSKLVVEWMSAAGYAVESAANFGAAKLKINPRLDVLIVDVRLEAFNGLQLAIQARSIVPTMRIVVISGWDDAVVRAEATSIGAVFLSKPFNEEQLLRVIGE